MDLFGFQMVSVAAVFGLIAAGWSRVLYIVRGLRSMLVVTIKVHSVVIDTGMRRYCNRNLKPVRFGLRDFSSFWVNVRPLKSETHVGYERFGNEPRLFRKGWWPLLLSRKAPSNTGQQDRGMYVTFLRGTWSAEELVQIAIDEWSSWANQHNDEVTSTHRRFQVVRLNGEGPVRGRMMSPQNASESGMPPSTEGSTDNPLTGEVSILGWDLDDLGPSLDTGVKPFDVWPFPPQLSTTVDQARHWLKSRDWYTSRHIPWRLGWRIEGIPGTGKTTFLKAVAQELDLPVLLFDLGSMSNAEFIKFWDKARGDSPCMVVFEDFDSVFEGRRNVLGEAGGGLDFSCLLNTIGGLQSSDGIFLAITTNRPEVMDAAMGGNAEDGVSMRPGRINQIIRMPSVMSAEARRILATRLLRDCPDMIDSVVARGEHMTPDAFSNLCVEVALNIHWHGYTDAPVVEVTCDSNSSFERTVS